MLEKKPAPSRHNPKVVKALRNFAVSISVFNILGYTVFGFEQPWLWPIIAVLTAYVLETGLEVLGARIEGRAPRFAGKGVKGVLEFYYPAHITALAVNMLIYVNDKIGVMIFGVIVAVGAKWVLRAPVRGGMRHFMNPSNLGITVILLLFPWAAIAQPYMFTEHIDGIYDWIVPAAILGAGTMLNSKLTGRMWLLGAWVIVFALQAVVRGLFFDTAIVGGLAPMTGVAFILFTNYMITDPGTTPSKPASQMAFGAGVAVLYGFFTGVGIAYGMFFATTLVCAIRGTFLWSLHFVAKAAAARAAEAAEQAAPVAHDPAPVNNRVVHAEKVVPA